MTAALKERPGAVDGMGITGRAEIVLRDSKGRFKRRWVIKNLVTAYGDRVYASRGAGLSTQAVPTGMKLGTGSTAVAKTGAGAALVTYLTGSNKAFEATYPSETGGVASYRCLWPAGTATTASNITEAVLVNEVISSDTTSVDTETISRILIPSPAPKTATDSLQITWTHTLLGA